MILRSDPSGGAWCGIAHWQGAATFRPGPAISGPASTKFSPTSAELCLTRTKFEPKPSNFETERGQIRPNSDHCWTTMEQIWATVGRARPTLTRCWPDLGPLRPALVGFGCGMFGHLGPTFGRFRPTRVDFDRMRAVFGRPQRARAGGRRGAPRRCALAGASRPVSVRREAAPSRRRLPGLGADRLASWAGPPGAGGCRRSSRALPSPWAGRVCARSVPRAPLVAVLARVRVRARFPPAPCARGGSRALRCRAHHG